MQETEAVERARHELEVCNACRYCEGFCAVYPALERRTLLELSDVSHLANLCHDCRACFDACMYTAPHAFDINIPQVLTRVRLEDYRRYVWPASPPRLLSGWVGVFSGAVAAVILVLALAVIHSGFGGLVSSTGAAQSAYTLIPYPELLVVVLLPTVFAVWVVASAGWRFWRETSGDQQALAARPVVRAAWQALTLRYLRGGGGNCYYPEDDRPSPARRRWHGAVAYGFGLCIVSTVAAGIMQDLLGIDPPYGLVSVPVLAGLVGGVSLLVGCLELLRLKAQASQVTGVAQMTVKDYGLLTALAFLALTGLATLLVRSTAAFPLVLSVHLASVVLAIAAAPYSKFPHLVYRFLALIRDNLEQDAQEGSSRQLVRANRRLQSDFARGREDGYG
jgi:citrate/tricarballylate utilization protein